MEVLYTPPETSEAFDGIVETYADLPVNGTAALGAIYLVRTSTGTWLINRKQAGLYQRVDTTGDRDTDWHYLGDWLEEFSDSNFAIYNGSDNSKELKFDLSGLTPGSTRTLTVPDASGTIALTGAITTSGMTMATARLLGRTTASTGAIEEISISTGLTMSAGVLRIDASYPGQTSITTLGTIATGVWQGTAIGDSYIASASTWNGKVGFSLTDARALIEEFGSTEGSVLARGASNWFVITPPGSGRVALTCVDGDAPNWDTAGVLLDGLGSTRGDILYRGAADWDALAAGTSGKVLVTGGSGADPAWSSSLSGLTITGSAFNGTVGATTASTAQTTRISVGGSLTNFDSGVLFGINANSGSIVAAPATTIIQWAGADSTNPRLTFDAFGGLPIIEGRRANGSNASKSAITNATSLLSVAAFGYKTTGYSTGSGGQLLFAAAEDWTDTATGTNCSIILVPKLSTTQSTAFTFSSEGVFGTQTIQTGAPSGGTAAAAKHGIYHATAPAATGYIEEERGGVLYKLLCST